jgi:hypothetical protein
MHRKLSFQNEFTVQIPEERSSDENSCRWKCTLFNHKNDRGKWSDSNAKSPPIGLNNRIVRFKSGFFANQNLFVLSPQYSRFPGITPLTPPFGSSISQTYRVITCTWRCITLCPAAAFVVHPDSVAVGGIPLVRQPTGMAWKEERGGGGSLFDEPGGSKLNERKQPAARRRFWICQRFMISMMERWDE